MATMSGYVTVIQQDDGSTAIDGGATIPPAEFAALLRTYADQLDAGQLGVVRTRVDAGTLNQRAVLLCPVCGAVNDQPCLSRATGRAMIHHHAGRA